MGMTHYWDRPTELPADSFAAAVCDVQRVVAATGIPVAGFEGEREPVFRPDVIVFNGACPEACEPFEIHQIEFDRRGRSVTSAFCKTEGRRYDLCVRVALIVLKHHLPDAINVGSDESDDAWAEARQVCQRLLGYGAEFRLRRK